MKNFTQRFNVKEAARIALTGLLAFTGLAHAADLFSNFNSYPVSNGVTQPITFQLSAPAQITQVETYHWNNGQGEKPGGLCIVAQPGSQVLMPNPCTWVPAKGLPGTANVQNAAWVATMNWVLPAGAYQIFDSSPNTISQNTESGGQGFAIVSGTYLSGADLENNFNVDGVANGGSAFQFTLPNATVITQIETYHWNNGSGAAPGAIGLRSVNAPFTVDYTYAAAGQVGSNNVQNASWLATMNTVIPAGTYEVIDSDSTTWAQNAQSKGVGFTIVRGIALSAGLTVEPPAPTPAPQAPPQSGPSGSYCGNSGYHLNLTPCSGNQNTPVTLVVVAGSRLTTVLDGVTFEYYDGGTGLPSGVAAQKTQSIMLTSGNGLAAGSLYQVNVPAFLCVAGNYSRWGVYPQHANGAPEGEIGLFRIEGCQ